jgi:hypothetical protein
MAASGCGSDSGGPATPVDISGAWNFTVDISNSTLLTACTATGTIDVTQSGGQASGSYDQSVSCTGPAGTNQTSLSGVISGGKVSGTKVTFGDDGGCKYTGTATGDPATAMSGSVRCTLTVNAASYLFSGTWSASR